MNEKDFVKVIAYQAGFDENALSLSTKFNDLGLDSLDHVEIIMMIEDDYDVEFCDSIDHRTLELETIEDLYNIVKFSKDKRKRYIDSKLIDAYNIAEMSKLVKSQKEEKMTTQTKTRPANHQKRWSEDDEGLLVFRYAQGTPIDLIAKELGRTKVAVLGRLAELGFVYFDKDENAYFTAPTLIYKF
jgi:acyl carrier protein